MDTGNYIGFNNGVYDVLNDRFLPNGSVPLNGMCTNYDYVGPDDPKFPEMRLLASKRRSTSSTVGCTPTTTRTPTTSVSPRCGWCPEVSCSPGTRARRGAKLPFVLLGSYGDSGISTFTELIQLTLGDYAVTADRTSLSGARGHTALDPRLVANHNALVCVFPDVQGTSRFTFNSAKLKALTGNDVHGVHGKHRSVTHVTISFKPIFHFSYMDPRPQLDSDDPAARNRLWVAEPDVQRRRFPSPPAIENLRDRMKQWAPFHFLLMLEALRDFRRRNYVLPVGACL